MPPEITDGAPEVVAGQGDATVTNDNNPSPWDTYLKDVPELHREPALAAMKHVEGLTTQKLQEAAAFRKQFEPYQELGLHERKPDEVAGFLRLAEMLDNPETAADTIRQLAEHYKSQHDLDVLDWGEQPDEGDEPADPMEALLDERLSPLEQKLQEREQAEQVAQIEQQIKDSIKAIEDDIGSPLEEDVQTDLLQVASGLFGKVDDPIAEAWSLMKRHTERAQKQLVDGKRKEPGQAEVGASSPVGGGQVSTSMADAKSEVAALLAAMRT